MNDHGKSTVRFQQFPAMVDAGYAVPGVNPRLPLRLDKLRNQPGVHWHSRSHSTGFVLGCLMAAKAMCNRVHSWLPSSLE